MCRYLRGWRREPDGPWKPHLWRYRPVSGRGKERGSLALVMPWVNPRYVRPLLEPVTGPLLWLRPVAGKSSHANIRTFFRPWPKAGELTALERDTRRA